MTDPESAHNSPAAGRPVTLADVEPMNPFLMALIVIGGLLMLVGVILLLVGVGAHSPGDTSGPGLIAAGGAIFGGGALSLLLWLTAAAITWRAPTKP